MKNLSLAAVACLALCSPARSQDTFLCNFPIIKEIEFDFSAGEPDDIVVTMGRKTFIYVARRGVLEPTIAGGGLPLFTLDRTARRATMLDEERRKTAQARCRLAG